MVRIQCGLSKSMLISICARGVIRLSKMKGRIEGAQFFKGLPWQLATSTCVKCQLIWVDSGGGTSAFGFMPLPLGSGYAPDLCPCVEGPYKCALV